MTTPITTEELRKWISEDRRHGVNINSGVLNDISAELITARAKLEAAEKLAEAMTIAANRLHRCSVDYDTGTREFIEVGEWADETRAAFAAWEAAQ